MMNVISVRRNGQRTNVERRRHTGSDSEPGAEIVSGGLCVGGAENIVFLDPRNLEGVEERNDKETGRDESDGDPEFGVAREKGLA